MLLDVLKTVEHTDDSLFATTTLSLPLGRRVCTLSASAIIRQFVESDSVTVVWVSDGECETSKLAKDTFKLFEVGWWVHFFISFSDIEGKEDSSHLWSFSSSW
jgi:hypothetical protein